MAVNVVLKSVFDDKGIKAAQSEFSRIGKSVGVAFAAVGAAVAVASAAAIRFGNDSIKAAEAVRQANDRLAQVNRSMGLFGTETQAVTERLIKFAEANELSVGVDAEVIKATQAKLLTFKNLAATANDVGGAMDRATMAALDLAAAGFGSAETNAIQLGKALQDPIKGITALRRAGVTFTDAEREKIKVLVESGRTLEAQNLILQAIETQVGGTARATATSSERMRLAFENVKESVGAALLPAFDDMVDVVVKDLTPALSEIAKTIGPLLADVLRTVSGVLKQATDKTTPLGKSVDNLGDSFNLLFDSLKGGKDDVEATSDVFGQLADVIAFVVTTAAGFVAFLQTIGPAVQALLRGDVEKFFEWLTTDPIDFQNNQKSIQNALKQSREQFLNTADSARKLNNISLDKLRGQLGDVRIDGKKLADQQRELYYAMRGLKVPTTTEPSTTSGGSSSGMTATEQKKEFDKIVKDTQSSLRKARAAYNTSVANARKQYTKAVVGAESNFAGEIAKANAARDSGLEKAALDNTKRVAEIQRSFANQLANIIQQSQDRLRDVYRTAVTTNIADLFGTEQVNKSVDALVGELRKKLEASRTLLENASKLAASGFSQTFIEQVVAAGTTSGNELAQSILEATPETQAELKSLYGALETQSERGMDELAKTIYEGAGLATSELRKLYDQTVVDQTTALAEQAALYAEAQAQILTEFDSAITEANAKRDEALAAAHASLTEALTAATKEYRDSLDEIEKDFKDRIDALGKLQAELLKRQGIVAGQIGGAQANIPTVAGQIDAVQKATIVTIPPTSAITGGNTVNVNVKVDPGTSAAQAGKKIANVVQKYTTAGGGGSAMPWQVL
jgi:DNA-directed RNA polymerase subunit F